MRNDLSFVFLAFASLSGGLHSAKLCSAAFLISEPSRGKDGIVKPLVRSQNAFRTTPPLSRRLPDRTGLRSRRRLSMALIPLSVDELDRMISVSGAPTGRQFSTYWGRTQRERYGRALESALIAFLGVFLSYFLSFAVGPFPSIILGTVFCFWAVLSPLFKAYQRNWEFLGGRPLVDEFVVNKLKLDPERAGLYGALFLGRIAVACVVESSDATQEEEYDLSDFQDYTMESDELDRFTGRPYLLRLQCQDSTGRELQIHTRMREDYVNLLPGMPLASILLSSSPSFTTLASMTDFFVVMDDDSVDYGVPYCWIGDYPYLNRAEVQELFAEDDVLWEALEAEATAENGDSCKTESVAYERKEREDDRIGDQGDFLVPVRKRRHDQDNY